MVLVVLGILGYWGYEQYRQKQQLETYLGNKYQESFYEMVENVEQIQVLLGKAVISVSPRKNIVNLNDIWNQSMKAHSELTRMPLSEDVIFRTAKFLSQTGDYSHVMAKKNAEGKTLSEEDYEQLIELREQAAQLSTALNDLEGKILQGKISWTEVAQNSRDRIKDEGTELSNIGEQFENIREDLNRYPTLIYDGPFSDHISEREPRAIEGSEISRSEARKKALNAIDISGETEDLSVIETGKTRGRIPGYSFQIKNEDNNQYTVDISEEGGFLVNIIGSRSVNEKNMELKEAAEKARDYLSVHGYTDMYPTYGEIKDNIAYLSMAYRKDDIINYPDIIDVQVALDNGEVIGIEALSYLVSHKDRKREKPELDMDEVRGIIGEKMNNIDEIRLAIIPKESKEEVLTYEVRGKVGEEIYLIYINADTGVEEKILQLIQNQDGTFTI
ncbi:MAG: germination protein YpeB [Bacillota bacterium]